MSSGITRDEWLKVLTEAGLDAPTDDPEALTVNDFMVLTGLNLATASRRLKTLVAAGKAEVVRVRRLSPHGARQITYQAYRLLK